MFVAALKASVHDPEACDIVASIQESLRATDDLLDALLDVSRLDAGVLQPRLRDLAVADLTDRLETEFASQAAAKGLALRTVASSAVVRTDPALLDRIMRNLLSNAVRYTEHGRVLLGCRRRGQSLRIEVWDTGIGIPADKRNAIFEEFYQLANAERDRTRGLGLGLAIVDRIARLLGHPVEVRSQPGKGSLFAVEVPLTAAERDVPSTQSSSHESARVGALSGALVVTIEDEPMQLRAMQRLFGSWGCDVVPAASTAEALTRLVELKRRPDVVVADYRLRDEMNGVQAITTLRAALGRTIPGIILTGDTEPAHLREAEASGFELLHKPVDTDRLFTVLSRMTSRAAAPAQL
jgi:CheY-like chemotaxis protein/two-component sensor histidine kinase